MSTTNLYTVQWHYEVAGKKAHKGLAPFAEEHVDHVSAASDDATTLTAVLVSKYGATPAGSTLVIDGIANAGPGTVNT